MSGSTHSLKDRAIVREKEVSCEKSWLHEMERESGQWRKIACKSVIASVVHIWIVICGEGRRVYSSSVQLCSLHTQVVLQEREEKERERNTWHFLRERWNISSLHLTSLLLLLLFLCIHLFLFSHIYIYSFLLFPLLPLFSLFYRCIYLEIAISPHLEGWSFSVSLCPVPGGECYRCVCLLPK